MAIFKLGVIITDIAGSIGGTVFKRGQTAGVLYNKGKAASKNILYQNAQLNPIASIFKKWGLLSPALQSDWNAAALLFLFPDKFGTMRNLKGRQLFTKLNIQLLPVGLYNDDPAGITSVVNSMTISNGIIDVANQLVNFDTYVAAGTVNYLVSAEITQNFLRSPTFTRRKVLYYDSTSGTSSTEFGFQFFNEFPYFDANYVGRIYVDTINDFGFKGVPIYLNTTTI